MLLQPRRTKRLRQAPSRVRGVLVRIVVVVFVLVVLEVAARGCVNAVTSRAIQSNLVDTGEVTVASGDLPMVFHYWVMGGLQNGSITLHDISASPMNIARLKVTAHDLRFARGSLLSAKAKLKGSPPYRISLRLSAQNLSGVLHTPVTFHGDHLIAQIDGDNIDVRPRIEGRTIVLADERNTHRIDLPGLDYLPCDPSGFSSSPGGITVSCTAEELPPYLAAATG